MNRHNLSKCICMLLLCMLISSCALVRKTGELINTLTPQSCINFTNNLSQVCLFPFSQLMQGKKEINNVQYIPLGFQLKSPGYYHINATVDDWVNVRKGIWKSKKFVTFQCEMYDTPVGNETKYFDRFDYDNANKRFFINMAPFNVEKGNYYLYIYIKSNTKPGSITIDLGDINNESVQSYHMFRYYYIKQDNQKNIHHIACDFIKKNNTLALLLNMNELAPEKEGNNDKEKREEVPAKSNLHPSGLLLCRKGYQNIEASVTINEWENKGNHWQGLMQTFKVNGKKYIGLRHQNRDDFGLERFEVKLCKYHKTGVPLLINIFSNEKPGFLTFNYQVNYQGKYPKFHDFTELKNQFSLDGRIPSTILTDVQAYKYKKSNIVKHCPALTLSFHQERMHVSKEVKRPHKKDIIEQPVHKKPVYKKTVSDNQPYVTANFIKPDKFISDDNDIIQSGIYFHTHGNFLVNASILKNEWRGKPGSWSGMMQTFTAQNLSTHDKKIQISKGLIFKKYNLEGRFQVNFGKKQVDGTPLFVTVHSTNKPCDLLFQFKKNIDNPVFVPFEEISNAFFIKKEPASWLYDEKPVNQVPKITLFYPYLNQHTQDISSNDKLNIDDSIVILPFSVRITNELLAKIDQNTVQSFHKIIMNAFQKENGIVISEMKYPDNIEPYSAELIDIPPPTIDHDVTDTPKYLFASICKQKQKDILFIGHFEEEFLDNTLKITMRIFDCKMNKFKTFIESISVHEVSDKSIQIAVKKLIKKIEPYLKRTI